MRSEHFGFGVGVRNTFIERSQKNWQKRVLVIAFRCLCTMSVC